MPDERHDLDGLHGLCNSAESGRMAGVVGPTAEIPSITLDSLSEIYPRDPQKKKKVLLLPQESWRKHHSLIGMKMYYTNIAASSLFTREDYIPDWTGPIYSASSRVIALPRQVKDVGH